MSERAMRPWRALVTDKVLRLTAVLMVLQGALVCSFVPYVSVLAVRQFGLGNRGFALMMIAATMMSVTAALVAGIRADQTADRRSIAIWSSVAMLVGSGVMTLAPGPVVFVLAHALIFPLSTLFGQLFAQGRLAAQSYAPATRDGILTMIRALFAAPFVVVLPLWSLALNHGVPVLRIYPVMMIVSAVMLGITLRSWPKVGATRWQDAPSGLSLRQALAELADPGLALRVAALGAVAAGGTLTFAVTGLVLTSAVGRGTGDVALYAGLVAGLEVPFMLLVPYVIPYVERTRLILIGTAIYAVQLVLLPPLAGSAWLWLLLLPGAVGGAVTLTLPIAYLQDQMARRPGTGSALMAVQKVAGDVMAAVVFAIGTALAGYGLAAGLGARSEERRVGKECNVECRSRWSPYH